MARPNGERFETIDGQRFRVIGVSDLDAASGSGSDSRHRENVADRAIYHVSQQQPKEYRKDFANSKPEIVEYEIWKEDFSPESRINGKPRRMSLKPNQTLNRRGKKRRRMW